VTAAIRYDRAQIEPKWEETPEGFLRIRATFARSGVQRYRRADGQEVVEYRPEEEVARKDALLSLANLPVTFEHPPDLLTPETAKDHQRGFTGSQVEYHSPFAYGIVTLTDRDVIDAVKRGDAREVSVGYRVEFDPTPGVTPDGHRYDGIQRQISGNHLAVTKEARGGREIRLHMDSAEAIDPIQFPTAPDDMSTTVAALTKATEALAGALQHQTRADAEPEDILEGDHDSPLESEKADGKRKKRKDMDPEAVMDEDDEDDWDDEGGEDMVSREEYDSLRAQLDAAKAAHQADLGRIDSLVERLDALEGDIDTRQDSSIDLNYLVAQRIELLDKAELVAGSRDRLDSTGSDREIMLAALEAAGEDVTRFDSESDAYVAGRFEAQAEYATRQDGRGLDVLSVALRGARADSADPVEDARQRMIAEQKAASERPLAARPGQRD
jgi:hypothetical protein